MQRREAEIPAFVGLNTAKAKANLAAGECCTLINYYAHQGKLRIRPKLNVGSNFTAAEITAGTNGARAITGLQQILVSGTLHNITLERQGFSTGSTALTDLMSLALTDSGELWRSVHLNGRGYAVRPGLTSIIGFDATNFWSVGIAAPSTAAVLATGAAAVIEAGTYIGVYTFVDADGKESDYSPVSNAHDPATAPLNWSSVDVSTNPRVVARKLYRTLPDQTGEYFYVGTIADNTTTTFTGDSKTVPQMGDLAPVGHTPPPSESWVDIATAFERIWVTDGEKVYGSLAEDPDSFDPVHTYQFSPDDGQKIVAIERVGTRLLVWKQGSLWALEQSLGAFEFLPRLVDGRNGITNAEAMAVADAQAYYFNGKALCVTDGIGPSVDISTGSIREFGEVDGSVLTNVAGGYYGDLGWVIFAIPSGTTGARRTFVYNTRQRNWFEMSWSVPVMKFVSGAPPDISLGTFNYPRLMKSAVTSEGPWGLIAVAGNATTPTDTFRFYAVLLDGTFTTKSGGTTYQDGPGSGVGAYITPQNIPQTVRWATQMGAPSRLHLFHRLHLCTDNPTSLATDANREYLATVALYFDEESSASKTRNNVKVVGTHKWKVINISAGNEKATLTEIEITRSSMHELIIEAARLEGDVWDQQPRELT